MSVISSGLRAVCIFQGIRLQSDIISLAPLSSPNLYLQSSHCSPCLSKASESSVIVVLSSSPAEAAEVDTALPRTSFSPSRLFSLSFISLRSICPISLLGSIILRTRFFNSFVSGNPPSVLRSQRSVSTGSAEDDVFVLASELRCRIVMVKMPPVTGTRLIEPMVVLNVCSSSCAN